MTNSDIQNAIEGAFWFAERGYRVFPVKAGAKTPPLLSQWQANATNDRDQVARWFMTQHVGANYGIVADSLIVLDVDTLEHSHGTKDGIASLDALEREHGTLPRTLTVRTATGGLHFYFRRPAGDDTFTKGADKLGPGLDIQTGNAYLIGPGSAIGSAGYTVLTNAEIAELPQWVVERIRDRYMELPAKRPAMPRDRVNNAYVEAVVRGELERLDDCQRSGWNGPPWDQTTYEVACNLIELANTPNSGYSHADALRDFLQHAPADEKFGLAQHEKKWRSAQRKVGASTRDIPAPVERPQQKPSSSTPAVAESHKPAPAPLPPAPKAIVMPKRDVDDFFGKHGFKVEYMADIVQEGFALGPDMTLWRYEDGIFVPDDIELMRRVTQYLSDRYRPGHYNAVRDFVMAMPGLQRLTSEQPDSRYIVLRNGVYDWRAQLLRAHSPEYGAITQLPIEFDPAATCPEFDLYLSEVVPEDTIGLVWELIGYLLMFGNPLQTAVILQGPGGNGKSTFLRVLQAMIGKQNVSALSLRQITEDRFALAGLLGKTANLAGDIDSRYLGDSSRFKQVVGGDLIEVERKYGQPFSFEPYAVPVFSANEFWKTGDTTHGYWRRWLPIPFPYPVVGKRPLNEADLFAETPGIFNQAMIGLRRLMERGKFEKPASVQALFNQMEASADVMADWFAEDESIVFNDPAEIAYRAARTEVYEAFKRWCGASGHKAMSSTNFYKRMQQLGYAETKSRGTRQFVGIELAPHGQPAMSGLM